MLTLEEVIERRRTALEKIDTILFDCYLPNYIRRSVRDQVKRALAKEVTVGVGKLPAVGS